MSVIECCGCSAHSRISSMLYTNRWDLRWFLCHLPHCWIRKLVCVGFARQCLRFKNSLQFCCCAQTARCCALHCLNNFHPNGIQKNLCIFKLLLLSECIFPIYTDFRDLWSTLAGSPALKGYKVFLNKNHQTGYFSNDETWPELTSCWKALLEVIKSKHWFKYTLEQSVPFYDLPGVGPHLIRKLRREDKRDVVALCWLEGWISALAGLELSHGYLVTKLVLHQVWRRQAPVQELLYDEYCRSAARAYTTLNLYWSQQSRDAARARWN